MLTLNVFAAAAILSTLVAGVPLQPDKNEAALIQSSAPATIASVGDHARLSERAFGMGKLAMLKPQLERLGKISPQPKLQRLGKISPQPKLQKLGKISPQPKLQRLPNIRKQVNQKSQKRALGFGTLAKIFKSKKGPKLQRTGQISKQPKPQLTRTGQISKQPQLSRQDAFKNPAQKRTLGFGKVAQAIKSKKGPELQRTGQISKQPQPQLTRTGQISKQPQLERQDAFKNPTQKRALGFGKVAQVIKSKKGPELQRTGQMSKQPQLSRTGQISKQPQLERQGKINLGTQKFGKNGLPLP